MLSHLFSKKTSFLHICHVFFTFSSPSPSSFSPRLLAPRTQLRVGLATATSSLFLGETEAPTKRKKRRICNVFFFVFLNEKKTSLKKTKLKKNTLWKFVSKLKNEFDDVDDVDMKENGQKTTFLLPKKRFALLFIGLFDFHGMQFSKRYVLTFVL